MKTKKCTKCCNELPETEEFFSFRKDSGKYRNQCKPCRVICQKEYQEKYPWMITLNHIKQRCNNPNNERYEAWGGRGIKCLITEEELKYLWFRDKAYNLKLASIDREDNDGNYVLENCRYVENTENAVKDKRKPVLQYDLNGNFIKEWISQNEIVEELNIDQGTISHCCNNKQKTAHGFVWKFK